MNDGYQKAAPPFVIPVPPTVNKLYFTNKRTGRRTLTNKGRTYKTYVGWIVQSWAMEYNWIYAGGSVAIEMSIYFPNKRKRDITNCIKVAEDGISEALGFDDRLCREFTVRLAGYDKENPRAIVTLVNGQAVRTCNNCCHFDNSSVHNPRYIGMCTFEESLVFSKHVPEYYGCNWFDAGKPYQMEEL